MLKTYTIKSAEQLESLNEFLHDDGKGKAFARVWKVQQRQGKNEGSIKAVVQFDTKTRVANAYREIHGKRELLGAVPYNKALRHCKEHFEMDVQT